MQRFRAPRCHDGAMQAVEGVVADPAGPISAARDGAADFDGRFALVQDKLIGICTGLVGADAAEDVVHDAYLRARGRWRQLRDDDLFDAWMTRIAINLCLNRHRSVRRLWERLPQLARRASVAEQRDIGLRELVERLGPRERTLVVLHYGHGYRFEEIAQLTGLSAVNVRSIVHRARRRLADQFREADA
jgi:RNA polymerase sigma-70 factor (ECF subfamily)